MHDNVAYVGLCVTRWAGRRRGSIPGVESNHCGICMAWNPQGKLIGANQGCATSPRK